MTTTATTTALLWNTGETNGTSRLAFFDVPDVNATIDAMETAAGLKGDWEYTEDGYNWWGLNGTFKGATFTVYTHKSGTLKIGGHPDEALDVDGLKAALLAL